MPNTPPPPPISQRPAAHLVEDLCLELRHVGGGDYVLPDSADAIAHIEEVQRIYVELEKRQVDVHERITQLSVKTGWLMDELLLECLAFPEAIPFVKESDSIRRAFRCYRCQEREMPDHKGMPLCDSCLAGALYSVESRIPEEGLVLFRTYNPSLWCAHSDADTVLLSLDTSDWTENGYCYICLLEEQQRRKLAATEGSLTGELRRSYGQSLEEID